MRVGPLRQPPKATHRGRGRGHVYPSRKQEDAAQLGALDPFTSRNLPCPRDGRFERVYNAAGRVFCRKCGYHFPTVSGTFTITAATIKAMRPDMHGFEQAIKALR